MQTEAEIVNAVLQVKKGATILGEVGDIQIENETDFNTFIFGAIVELNENGRVPEGITYEKILRLAQEIREETSK